jgi:hypothetical protein
MRRIIALAFLLFFVSGCLQLEQEPVDGPFVGGAEGLALEFLDNAPPPKLLDTDVFQITVFVTNKGEWDVLKDTAIFTLGNSRTFGIDQSIQGNTENIEGTEKFGEGIVPGGVFVVNYQDASYRGPPIITEQAEVPVSVTAFYPYGTNVASRLCISQSGESNVCQYPGQEGVIKTLYNSGAPVMVGEVKQFTSTYHPSSNTVSVAFTVNLMNVGGGTLYHKDTIPTNITPEDADWVYVSEIGFGDFSKQPPYSDTPSVPKLECGAEDGFVYVDDDGGSFNCRLEVSAAGDYEDALTMRLDYKYSNTVTESISFITFEA